MQHHDNKEVDEDKITLNKILKYKHSYFQFNGTWDLFPKLRINDTSLPMGMSEYFCIHFWWQSRTDQEKLYKKNTAF
jgi:hypothetical protein